MAVTVRQAGARNGVELRRHAVSGASVMDINAREKEIEREGEMECVNV